MTVLSVSRLVHIKSVGSVGGSTPAAQVKLATMAALIVLFSAGISCLPLLPQLEDFFVNGVYYRNVTLFTGIVDKRKHQQILRTYNGRFRNNMMSWRNIGRMVQEMFSEDFGGIQGSRVEFYGNDGVCIFKYLVTERDPQHFFSISILLVNFTCFFFITASYLMIHRRTTLHSRKSKTKISSALRSRHRRFQTKISIIIITDFLCWIPFIVVCFLHFCAVIDASPWYPIFSIFILPINSVINPLLYDDSVIQFCSKMFGRGSALISHSVFAASQLGDQDCQAVAGKSHLVNNSPALFNHGNTQEGLQVPLRVMMRISEDCAVNSHQIGELTGEGKLAGGSRQIAEEQRENENCGSDSNDDRPAFGEISTSHH